MKTTTTTNTHPIIENSVDVDAVLNERLTAVSSSSIIEQEQEHSMENISIQEHSPFTPHSYSSFVQKERGANITPENITEILLCQIPSIRTVAAKAILSKYPHLKELIHAMETDIHCLDDIKTVNNRKIGKNVIENMFKYLL